MYNILVHTYSLVGEVNRGDMSLEAANTLRLDLLVLLCARLTDSFEQVAHIHIYTHTQART